MQDFKISSQNAAHIQAYIEYNNIVGNADGGKMFTEKQYEDYKNHLRKNAKNRVYTSWRNSRGMDCKMIGPASTCMCGHKYKDHNYLNPTDKKVVCKTTKCSCPCFYYVPVHGSMDFKCLCKSSYTLHDPITKKCPKGKAGSATGKFTSTWSCSCQEKFGDHYTVIETREERIALGKPVDDVNRMMGELGSIVGGGISNFSSMVDGAESYGAQIDALGALEHQERTLGYEQQRALPYKSGKESLGGGVGKQKLAVMNDKLRHDNEANDMYMQGNSKSPYDGAIARRSDQGVSALDLFNTPHNFARAKIGIKKPIKY